MRLGRNLQEFAKMLQEFEEFRQSNQIYIDSNTRQMARDLQQLSEHKKIAWQMQAVTQIADVFPKHAATAQSLQKLLFSPEVTQTVQDIAALQRRIESQATSKNAGLLVANQAFADVASQYQKLAKTVRALLRLDFLLTHSRPSPEEPKLEPKDPDSPAASIYDQTVDPYEPFREDIYEIQLLLAQYLFAATVDQGELSEDLSKTEKKHIRLGLAMMIGFAAALPVGLIFGYVAIPVGVGTAAWSSRELDEYYDIKKRQQLPEDESK